MIDLLGELRRIESMDNTEGFNRAFHSLQAIALAVGAGPSVGLWTFLHCDAAMAASLNTIVTDNLGGLLWDDVFNDQFWVQVLYNADAPGTAPEGQIRRVSNFVAATQTFTVDPFTANVEAGDLLCIFHESILSMEILGVGTLDTSSTTVPADSTRTEANNYFRGCQLMPTEGACRFQPRLIVQYTGVGGIFTLDPGNPFTALPGLVDYVVVRGGGAVVGSLAPVLGVLAKANNLLEQVVFTIPAMLADVDTLYLDLVNLTQNCDIRVYHQIDGANYRVIETFNWTVGMDDGVYFRKVSIDAPLQVTVQSTALEGAIRNIPWKYFLRS